MAEFQDREHFIPIRPADVVDLLCTDPGLTDTDRESLRQLGRLLAAVFHYEYHGHLEKLKNAYAPFDPDADTRTLTPLSPEEKQKRLDGLFEDFIWLLERANFKRLSREEIAAATKGASDWGLNMDVNFDVFERLEVFVRGDIVGTRTRQRWQNRYRPESVSVPVYQRLVLILKQQPHKRLGPNPDTESVFLKVFKDIPKLDLEMLLPGTKVVMPLTQRLKLGGSLASTMGYVGYKLEISKLIAGVLTGNVFTFWGPLSLILGYGYRQYAGYQTMRQSYSLKLAQSLYYQNLDNNAGVLFRLLNEAEEQEFREAVLAYFFLWRLAGEAGWTKPELDDHVEHFLEERAKVKVDFEIGDAMAKLERLGLTQHEGEHYRAVPVLQALETLDRTWDNYFLYHNVPAQP
jgi:hypothetical protein